MKKTIKVLIIMLLTVVTILAINTNVDAASVSIKAGKGTVTEGKNVSVTVSFGEKVSAAQFKLSYDKSKFEYVSCSSGQFGTGTNTYVYVNYEDVADLGSVTLTFKAKETGSGSFSISGVVLSVDASISNGSTTVKVEEAKSTSNSNDQTSSTTNSKPNKKTTKKKDTKNEKKDEETQEEPEEVNKTELTQLRTELTGIVETDYTEESWKALQEAIEKAEGATTSSEYDEIKDKLSLDNLEKVEFEKDELDKVLRDLIGKDSKDYTAESWNELQDAINTADSAELKSEYDAVKDKLTVKGLVLDEKDFFEQIMEDNCGHKILILSLAASTMILFILVIILFVAYRRAKNIAY